MRCGNLEVVSYYLVHFGEGYCCIIEVGIVRVGQVLVAVGISYPTVRKKSIRIRSAPPVSE